MAPTDNISPGEVIADPGLLYAAPLATAEPGGASALASLPSAWRTVGYTEEGSTHKYDIKTETLDVAEELDPIRYQVTSRESSLSFKMAQASRRNAALALNLGAAATSAATNLEPPSPAAMLRVMLLWVSADDLAVRGVLFRRCLNMSGLEMSRSKSPNKTLIEVEFGMEIPARGTAPFTFYPNSDGVI